MCNARVCISDGSGINGLKERKLRLERYKSRNSPGCSLCDGSSHSGRQTDLHKLLPIPVVAAADAIGCFLVAEGDVAQAAAHSSHRSYSR